MSAVGRLYEIDNKAIKKSINIEDTLYSELIKLSKKKYDATISELINVSIEDYIENNSPSYYEKPERETVTYRSIMLRRKNFEALNSMHRKTGISVTRLLNASVKEFLENIK